jgi:hypothetical protein
MTGRGKALEAAVEQLLAGIADLTGLCERLEAAGGNGRLITAIRARLTATPPVAGKPEVGVWAEAAERMIAGGRR